MPRKRAGSSTSEAPRKEMKIDGLPLDSIKFTGATPSQFVCQIIRSRLNNFTDIQTRFLSSPLVKITTYSIDSALDTELQSFVYVHLQLLRESSTYFAERLPDKTGGIPPSDLFVDDILSRPMAMIVDWLYRVDITNQLQTDLKSGDLIDVLTVYQSAHFLGLNQLQNRIVDVLRSVCRKHGHHIAPEFLTITIGQGLMGTPIIDFLARFVIWEIMSSSCTLTRWNPPADWWKNSKTMAVFGRAFLEYHLQSWPDPSGGEGCHFHDHNDGSECAAVIT